jgi:hypothetical protein
MVYPGDDTDFQHRPGGVGFLRGGIGLSNRAVAINARSSTRSASLSALSLSFVLRGPESNRHAGKPQKTPRALLPTTMMT